MYSSRPYSLYSYEQHTITYYYYASLFQIERKVGQVNFTIILIIYLGKCEIRFGRFLSEVFAKNVVKAIRSVYTKVFPHPGQTAAARALLVYLQIFIIHPRATHFSAYCYSNKE